MQSYYISRLKKDVSPKLKDTPVIDGPVNATVAVNQHFFVVGRVGKLKINYLTNDFTLICVGYFDPQRNERCVGFKSFWIKFCLCFRRKKVT